MSKEETQSLLNGKIDRIGNNEDRILLDQENQDFQSTNSTTKLYKRRWAFLALLVIAQILNAFNLAGFGQISRILVLYFHTSHEAIDWITNVMFIGVAICSPFLAWLCHINKMPFKTLSVTAAFCIVVAYTCITLSVAYKQIFSVVIGQLLNGIGAAMLLSVPSVFAVIWFPENEVGTAISFNFIGISLGNILGFVLPTNVLLPPENFNSSGNSTSKLHIWGGKEHQLFLKLFISMMSVSLIIFILMLILFENKPPLPPTNFQAFKSNQIANEGNFTCFLKQIKHLLSDLTFTFSALALGLIFHVNTLEFIMLDEIVHIIIKEKKFTSEVISGLVLTTLSVGSIVGCFISGELVNRFKNYQRQVIIGAFLSFLTSCSLLLSFCYRSVAGLFLCNAFYGLSMQICVTAFYEILTQHTYPINETFVSLWGTAIHMSVSIPIAVIGRYLFDDFGGLGVLVFYCACVFVALVITCLIRPKNNRLAAES